MSRTTMSELIQTLRGMTDAAQGEWANGTANYWDADQLQVVLDRNRQDIYNEQLKPIQRWGGGSASVYDYQSSFTNFEQTSGGTSVFWLEDSTGADVGTANYTADYLRGFITFAANQMGTIYYLSGRSYDLNAAAADVWRMKAARYAVAYDLSTDNHSLKRSQMHAHAVKMADYYESLGGPSVATLFRSDVA